MTKDTENFKSGVDEVLSQFSNVILGEWMGRGWGGGSQILQ